MRWVRPAVLIGPALAALLLCPPAAVAQGAAADSGAVPASARAQIDSANADWLPALRRKDAAAIAAPYADDGVLVAANGESFRGRAAVEEAMRASIARVGDALRGGRLVQDEITRVGDLLYEWGHADLEIARPNGQIAHVAGRYLTVWKQDAAGRWRILRNLSLP